MLGISNVISARFFRGRTGGGVFVAGAMAIQAVFFVFVLVAQVSEVSGQGVPPTNIVAVTPSNMHGWSFVNDQTNGTGSGAIVSGPSTASFCTDSAQFTLTGASDAQMMQLGNYLGTKLSDITKLVYSTYQPSSNPSNAQALALQFNVDRDVTDADNSWQGRIVYEPYWNNGGTVPLGTWTQWDALSSGNSKWWFSKPASFGNNCPAGAPCTLSQIIALYPNIGIHPTLGDVILKAGSGWTQFTGSVNSLTVGVSGTNTEYDFGLTDAVKFVFANVPSVQVTGTATFNIEALNPFGNIDSTFQQGVTLTVGGSGSGAGLVTIINGIGTSTVSDTVAETVSLGLQDTQSTGLCVNATSSIAFSSLSGTSSGVSNAGIPGVPVGIKPTVDIIFSGLAYPGSSVSVIRKDQGLAQVPTGQNFTAAADGSFLVQMNNVTRLEGQTYLLSLTDRDGHIAQTRAYNIPAQEKFVRGDIIAAPTISFDNLSVVTKGDAIAVAGYATPGAKVEILVDGQPAGEITVKDASGKYRYSVDTSAIATGRHSIMAAEKYSGEAVAVSGYANPLSKDEIFIDRSTDGSVISKDSSGSYSFVPATGMTQNVSVAQPYTKTGESGFSNQRSFTVSPLKNPRLDLNGDGTIDVKDLSIFLSYLKDISAGLGQFRSTDKDLVRALDFNNDGVLDIKDISIFLKAAGIGR